MIAVCRWCDAKIAGNQEDEQSTRPPEAEREVKYTTCRKCSDLIEKQKEEERNIALIG